MSVSRSDRVEIVLAHLREMLRKYGKAELAVRWSLTAVAVVLGFIGFQIRDNRPYNIQNIMDAWYNTLGLLTIHLPHDLEKADLHWSLQVARLLLPLMAIWLSIAAYVRLARQKTRFFSLFRANEHVIVVGPGARAHAIARQFRVGEAPHRVVYITELEDDTSLADLHELNIVILRGAPVLPDTYMRANVKRAHATIIAGDRGMDNIRACETIRTVVLEHRSADVLPLSLVVAIDNPETAAILDVSFHQARDRRIEYRLLDVFDNVAHRLVTRHLLSLLGSTLGPPTIVMIGWSGPAPAIFRRLLLNGPPGFKLIVADRDAERTKAALMASSPGLVDFAGLRFITVDIGVSLRTNTDLMDTLSALRLGAIIISGDSDESNFRTAIEVRRFARTRHLWTGPMYVRQQSGEVALNALRKLIATENIDVSRIHAFGSIDEQYAPAAVLHEVDESIARAVHEDFLRGPFGKDPGPNTVPWEDLLETFRVSNRRQADHIDVKLANAGCRRVRKEGGADFVFSGQEIERLAALEHWRWCADRWSDGWIYGAEKNVERLQHNLLVPYENLADDQKDQDRKPVQNLSKLLALANAAIQREQHIHVGATEVCDVDLVDALKAKAEACERSGLFPIVDLELANAADLTLARKLQQHGLAVLLKPAGSVDALLERKLSKEELVLTLDAAESVVPPTDALGCSTEQERIGDAPNPPSQVADMH